MAETKTTVKYYLREVSPSELKTKEVVHTKCGNCKCWRTPEEFLSETGRKLKCCEKCRAKAKRARDKKKAKKEDEKIKYDSDEAERKYMIKLAERRLNNLHKKA